MEVAARVTVTVYVFVVLSSSAVTSTVMTLLPTASEIVTVFVGHTAQLNDVARAGVV